MTTPTIFNPNQGKVEVEAAGLKILFYWVTWEAVNIMSLHLRIAGDAYEWTSSLEPTSSNVETFDLIWNSLFIPDEHHHLSDVFTWWKETDTELRVTAAVLKALQELEITSEEV